MKDIGFELKSEELKNLIDCLDCSLVILSESGKTLWSNKSFKECGYSIDSIIHENINLKNIQEKTEEKWEIECDGKSKKIPVKITPLEISNYPEKVFLVEVCSSKTTLSGIIESWYKTIDALSEMLYVVDEDYNLVKLNSSAAELSGNHPKDLIGRKCYRAVFGKGKACKNCILPEIIASNRKEKLQTIRKEWNRSFLVSAVRIKKGEYLFIMEDITRVEQLERNLAEVRRFTSIGAIISHIRHTVGNAVNAIKCSLQVLEHMYEELSDKERKEFLTRSLGEINRMESLLYTLREFSRYEGIGSSKLNLTELISDNKDKFNKYCKDSGVDFHCECETKEFIMKGDKLLIIVALTEIIDNALEAMENSQEKELFFYYSVKDSKAVIEMTDKGSGIAENHLPKVAEPFFTTKTDRTGLGLYQAAKIIKKQGGDINFSGEKGGGTTVKITFRKQ
jgi:signal transduction histidine kinase